MKKIVKEYEKNRLKSKQAGAELGPIQLKLGLGFTTIKMH